MENVRFFIHEDYPVDGGVEEFLNKMADVKGVVKPVVVLPDIHFKSSYHTPTGVVVKAQKTIISKFLNANCAMSFITTPFFIEDIDERMLDGIFSYLRANISVSTRASPIISKEDLKSIVRDGAEWTIKKYGLDPADLVNFENEGSLLKDDIRTTDGILSSVPEACQQMGLFSFGVLGYGNYFIEMQTVDEIIDPQIAKAFRVAKGQVCFMIHGDSRAFGQSIFDFYSQKAKKLFGMQQAYKKLYYSLFSSNVSTRSIRNFLESFSRYVNRVKSAVYPKAERRNRAKDIYFDTIDADSKEGEAYLTGTYCALNYGYANRAYMASVIRDALKKSLGRDSSGIHVLWDGNHDALQKENIDGKEFYVHRNGANRALPPGCFPHHNIFSKTGQPVLLPSALGKHSFLCAATKGCPESYYSSCHGTGRLIDRGEARNIFKAENVLDDMKSKKVRIYDYGRGYIAEESPAAFKDVDKILQVISKHDIAQPVARLRPVADLKGWR